MLIQLGLLYIKEYLKTRDLKYLRQAVNEVKYRSNKHQNEGVQRRMDREALMLASYQCPLPSHQNPIPDNASISAQLGKTVIPRVGVLAINENELDIHGNKKQYYIWRTKHDGQVRLTHQLCDGKIFDINMPPNIGHPGDDYNCRCVRDFNIPDFVNIEKPDEQKMIKKYITDGFDLPGFCIK